MALQHFHRFVDLPRELQLCIWDIHDADNFPHYRHYFRRMAIYSGRLYAAADQATSLTACTVARESDPAQDEIPPDFALTPNTKIRLPGDTHWLSISERTCAEEFILIQQPSEAPNKSYVWANFKHDTFCFANARDGLPSADFLGYFKDEGELTVSSTVLEDRTHWFFRIQHLALVIGGDEPLRLGAHDRLALADHPSLKTIAIVTTPSKLICRQTGYHAGIVCQDGGSPHRVPLDEFIALLEAAGSYCGCGSDSDGCPTCNRFWEEMGTDTETETDSEVSCCIHTYADQLRALGREAEGLFVGRKGRGPRVSIKVEVSWRERPDVEALLAVRREREAEARWLSEQDEGSQPAGNTGVADDGSDHGVEDIHSGASPGGSVDGA